MWLLIHCMIPIHGLMPSSVLYYICKTRVFPLISGDRPATDVLRWHLSTGSGLAGTRRHKPTDKLDVSDQRVYEMHSYSTTTGNQ